jgi:hypothetical protein
MTCNLLQPETELSNGFRGTYAYSPISKGVSGGRFRQFLIAMFFSSNEFAVVESPA